MKKNIIALAVASAFAAPVAMAGAPTVYGLIDMHIDSITDKGTQVKDDAGRIGFKGASDLGNGLKAIYQVELGDHTSATSGGLSSGRNSYVGLAGGFGAVLLGRHDTPMKMSQPKDLFNDRKGDLEHVSGGLGLNGKAGENRLGNILAYVSPSFGGVKIAAASASLTDSSNSNNTGLSNIYSLAAMYGSKKKGLYLSAAYDSYNKDFTGAGKDGSAYRLAAQYSVAGLVANAMYADYTDVAAATSSKNGNAINLNLGYKIGKLMPKIKYTTVDYKNSTMKSSSNYAVGLNYALGKKTVAFVEYISFDKNNQREAGTKDISVASIGLQHKF